MLIQHSIFYMFLLTGLLTFADGTHGLPRNEGYFEGGTIVKREKCPSVYHRALQAAERARTQPV